MMDKYLKDSIELLRRMVGTPSLSFGEAEVCSILEQALSSWGVDVERMGNNLIASYFGAGEKAPVLAFDAHIDTVPAAQSYTRDPFDPGKDESVVYGLGSNDDGGSVVAMIAAFRHLADSGSAVNLVLTLCCEEERSGPDGAAFIYGAEGPFACGTIRKPDAVIVGEPTGMKAATSERGLLVLDGTARGVSGHAARSEGVNAIYIAMEDIRTLLAYPFDRHSEAMGEVKLSVTQINAGTAHNVVPDSCSFVVDIRPTDRYSNVEILEALQSVCKSSLKARNLRNKSSATLPHGRLMSCIERMGLETFSSPTTSDWIRIDADAVKMGPGESSRSHRADEFIFISEIEDAILKYINFTENFFNGDTVE